MERRDRETPAHVEPVGITSLDTRVEVQHAAPERLASLGEFGHQSRNHPTATFGCTRYEVIDVQLPDRRGRGNDVPACDSQAPLALIGRGYLSP